MTAGFKSWRHCECVAPVGGAFPAAKVMSDRWEARFRELKKFKEEHGNCNVPQKHPLPLGYWVEHQRYKEGSRRCDADQTQKLAELGFRWERNIQSAMDGNDGRAKGSAAVADRRQGGDPAGPRSVRQRRVPCRFECDAKPAPSTVVPGFDERWEARFQELKEFKETAKSLFSTLAGWGAGRIINVPRRRVDALMPAGPKS